MAYNFVPEFFGSRGPASSYYRSIAEQLSRKQAEGKMSPDLTPEMIIVVNERIKNPRSSTVARPKDLRSERQLKMEQDKFDGLRLRGDDRVYDLVEEASQREIRWIKEQPEYERRLAEAEKLNDICEAAVKTIHGTPEEKAKLPRGRLQQAYHQLYEIAITGHLKGVSEGILGSQENTLNNMLYHYDKAHVRPEKGSDYYKLKYYQDHLYSGIPLEPERPKQAEVPAQAPQPAKPKYPPGSLGARLAAARSVSDLQVNPPSGGSNNLPGYGE